PSERDQNFLISGAAGPLAVLKIANPSDTEAILAFQHAAIAHLARHALALAVPTVIRSRSGDAISSIAGADGRTYFVRALSYVPGSCLADVRPHSRELLRGLGARLGEMDRAFASFTHPAMHRDLPWDLRRTGRLVEHLDLIDRERRRLVEQIVSRFQTTIEPRLAGLRASVIHNDWNDFNILVATAAGEDPRVVGAIDFGDLLHSYRICDLAIALAYVALGKSDPIGAASEVVRGYHGSYPLDELEVEVLFDLMRGRLATSVVMAARQRAAVPDNAYLGVSEAQAWQLLESLETMPGAWPRYAFRDACGLTPCPKSLVLVRSLEQRRDEMGPVLAPDPRAVRSIVIDLGVGNAEFSDLSLSLPPEGGSHEEGGIHEAAARTLTGLVFGAMRQAGAQLGIGRYDEARLAYRSESFRRALFDGSSWRTVHLGLDLFAEPGTPVLAPLDGVIHSFRNNAAALDYGPTVIVEHQIPDSTLSASGDASFFTLYGHLSVESLDGLFRGKRVKRGDRIGALGDVDVNGGWPPHLHFQIICDLFDMEGDFPGVAAPEERTIWLSICPDPNSMVGLRRDALLSDRPAVEDLLARRHDHIGPSLSVAYRRPLVILRGYRQYLYDQDGRMFLDAVNNVPHVGHCHPRVIRAGQRQIATLNTNTRYLHPLLTEYAARLTATLPAPLRVCFFVNSGSEANELALRIARAHTRARDVIVVEGAYHGNTSTLVEISPYKFDGPGGSGKAGYVQTVCMPDPYRGPHRGQGTGPRYARHVAEAIERIRAEPSSKNLPPNHRDEPPPAARPAAFFCESLLSCGGQIVLPDGYLAEAYRLVREAGGVCVADEVQVGLGRVGTHFWGFETQKVVPDIVVLGKPLGNGHPLGAVITTPELAASFATGMEFFSTFGGNPVSCAIGLAVLDVIRDEGLQEHARRVGERLLAGLKDLACQHAIVGDVRGRGLFAGIELVADRETRAPAARQASYVINRMRDRGILVSTDGPLHNVIKVKPPLVFSPADADRLIETLDTILHETPAQPA
ncbi:MAG: aminotransferase class III-fold pyridoxal phosphate-dependent enzyme, partial [Acidobacteria bacterium]|nr:aminotransferase class III-fold pyridoxal phosphate-dependent enzyme [Acidobacteriota bacterium]